MENKLVAIVLVSGRYYSTSEVWFLRSHGFTNPKKYSYGRLSNASQQRIDNFINTRTPAHITLSSLWLEIVYNV